MEPSRQGGKKKKVYNYVIVSRMHHDPSKNAEHEMFDTETGADETETALRRKMKNFTKEEMEKLDLAKVQMDNEHGESTNIGHIVKSWAGKGGLYGVHVIRGDTEDGKKTQREISENRKRELSMNHNYGLWKVRGTGDYISEKEVVEVSVVEKGARPDCHMLMGIPVEAGSEADKILQGEIMCSQKQQQRQQQQQHDTSQPHGMTEEEGEQEAQRIARLIASLQDSSHVANSNTNEQLSSIVDPYSNPNNNNSTGASPPPLFTAKDFIPMSSTDSTAQATKAAAANTTSTAGSDQPPKPFVNQQEIAKLPAEDRQKIFSKQTPESAQALSATGTPATDDTPAPVAKALASAPTPAAADIVKALENAPKEKQLEVIAKLAAKLDEKNADLEEYQQQKRLRLAREQAGLKEDLKQTIDMYNLLGVQPPENIGTCAAQAANAIKDNPGVLQPLLIGSQQMSAKIRTLHKGYQEATSQVQQLKAQLERQNRAQALTSSLTTNSVGAPSASRAVVASVLYNDAPVNTSNLMFNDLAPAASNNASAPAPVEGGRQLAPAVANPQQAQQQQQQQQQQAAVADPTGEQPVAEGSAAFSATQRYQQILASNPYFAQAQQRGVNARLSVNNVGIANDILGSLQQRRFTEISARGEGQFTR